MIRGVDQLLALADDETKIIPGHGPLANKAQLREYRQMLQTAYERLLKLKADGKTAADAIAAMPLADLEAQWGNGMFTGDRWIEIIFSGVY
jgi:glyoxylase-like metal-dependent hydrolase (beta-lactamase superfamily II)